MKEDDLKVYNKHLMLHLALNGEEVKYFQFCCEFVEQFITENEESHRELCEKFNIHIEDAYKFGDKWSFDLRRMIESQYNRTIDLTPQSG